MGGFGRENLVPTWQPTWKAAASLMSERPSSRELAGEPLACNPNVEDF